MLKTDREYEHVEISVATPNDLVDVSNGRTSARPISAVNIWATITQPLAGQGVSTQICLRNRRRFEAVGCQGQNLPLAGHGGVSRRRVSHSSQHFRSATDMPIKSAVRNMSTHVGRESWRGQAQVTSQPSPTLAKAFHQFDSRASKRAELVP
jgi:hypothetical protein